MKKFLSILLVLAMVLSFGIPAFAEDGDQENNNNSADVVGNYTPSDDSDLPEAKWGASKDAELTGSGTLEEAIDEARKANSTVKYIQIQKNITIKETCSIYDADFTLDLNGKIISGSEDIVGDIFDVLSGVVVFTDGASGGAVKLTAREGANDQFAIYVDGGSATISAGTYSSNTNAAVRIDTGTLLITGGSFTGNAYSVMVYSDTAIQGGTFSKPIYCHGTNRILNLSDYPTTAKKGTTPITDIEIVNGVDTGVSLVQLPSAYHLYKADDETQSAVDALLKDTVYKIRSDNPTVTIASCTNGTVKSDKSNVPAGETVTLTVTPASGYVLASLTVENQTTTDAVTVTDATNGTYQFTMPNADVTVTANFRPIAKITGMYLTVGTTKYTSGTVTLTPLSETITLTFTGEHLDKLTENQKFGFSLGGKLYDVTLKNNQNLVANGSGTELTCSTGLDFLGALTTATELKFSNDGGNSWTGSGIYVIYQSEITSVDIEWGTLAFVYSDEQDANGAEKGWSCENGANQIKITNKGTVAIEPSVTYTQNTGYERISGTVSVLNLENNMNFLTNGESKTYVLTLDGKPTTALDGAEIGYVTVTIKKNEGQ